MEAKLSERRHGKSIYLVFISVAGELVPVIGQIVEGFDTDAEGFVEIALTLIHADTFAFGEGEGF